MKTREIRSAICKALLRAEKGELPPEEAKQIIGLANQIQASLSTEVKVAQYKLRAGASADAFGQLDVTS